MPAWVGVVGCVLSFVIGSGSEFVFGVWDRFFPVNQPPKAVVTIEPKEGKAPLTVVVRASDSSDPEGGPLTYAWSVNGKPIEATDRVHELTFDEIGTYAIALVVKDHKGLVDDADETITVSKPYDADRIVDAFEDIDRSLREGDFLPALRMANQFRYTCEHLSIPADQCARFHASAAEARLRLGRYEEGFESISAATEMMPDDVIHMVRQSEFHIVLNQSDRAVAELEQLDRQKGKGKGIGTRGLLYIGIANAIVGDYVDAKGFLKRATRTPSGFRQSAEFALFVTELLQRQTSSEFDEQGMRLIVCGDGPLRTLFLTESTVVERHIIILRVLIDRLDADAQGRLRTAMEAMTCA